MMHFWTCKVEMFYITLYVSEILFLDVPLIYENIAWNGIFKHPSCEQWILDVTQWAYLKSIAYCCMDLWWVKPLQLFIKVYSLNKHDTSWMEMNKQL